MSAGTVSLTSEEGALSRYAYAPRVALRTQALTSDDHVAELAESHLNGLGKTQLCQSVLRPSPQASTSSRLRRGDLRGGDFGRRRFRYDQEPAHLQQGGAALGYNTRSAKRTRGHSVILVTVLSQVTGDFGARREHLHCRREIQQLDRMSEPVSAPNRALE